MLALLSTSLPLSMSLTATFVAVDSNGALVMQPSAKQIKLASSLHVLAFSSHGDLLVVESEGGFTIDEWVEVLQKARLTCHGEERDENGSQDVSMKLDDVSDLGTFLKDAVERKVAKEQRWKKDIG